METVRRRLYPPTALAVVAAALLALPSGAQVADIGLSSVGAQRFGRPSLLDPNVDGNDYFGWALATGDFNGDGADDLASGARGSDGPGAAPVDDCGEVVVRYGVPGGGLAPGVASTVLGQFVAGSGNPAEEGDMFGFALAACNLNGDAFDDLAVGVPFEDLIVFGLDFENSGLVEVFYGTNAGLVPPSSVRLREQQPAGPGQLNVPTPHSDLGWALACDDFNGDGYDDLAIGIPFRDAPGPQLNAGRIFVYPGSASGVGAGWFYLDQDSPGMLEEAGQNDQLGRALAAGDFDGDTYADVAIGVPFETDGGGVVVGMVQVIHGDQLGLGFVGNVIYFDAAFGGSSFASAQFGLALAAGNFDADPYDDLAIGARYNDVDGADGAGEFVEAFGSAGGLVAATAERFDQNRILGDGASAPQESFGFALAAGDFDGDGADDLAASSPWEAVLGNDDGAVVVVMGAAGAGLEREPNRFRQINHGFQGYPGDPAEDGVYFGWTLATGDFDGDGHADLAIGSSPEDEGGLENVGTVTVLYGALFADGFEEGGASRWSRVHPGMKLAGAAEAAGSPPSLRRVRP